MHVVVLAVVLGLAAWLITFLPIPDPFRTIIWVVMVLFLLWELLAAVGYVSSTFRRPP